MELSEKDWLEIHMAQVESHYSLWNYLWVTGAAAISIAVQHPKDFWPLYLGVGFLSFALINLWILCESQQQKRASFEMLNDLGRSARIKKPIHAGLIVVGHFAVQAIIGVMLFILSRL